MPQIPEYLARQGLPAASGVARGGVAIPVAQEPQADTAALTAVDRGLQAFGQGVENAGVLLQRGQALEAARQQADAVLRSKLAQQQYIAASQEDFARLRDDPAVPYDELPQRLSEAMSTRLAEMKSTLPSDRAQQLFEIDAVHYQTVLSGRALEERSRRREQVKQYVMTQEVQQAQDGAAQATSPMEQTYYLGRVESLAADLVKAGLASGGQAAELVQKTRKAVEVQAVQNMMIIDPEGVLQNLRAQQTNATRQGDEPALPLNPRLPLAPMDHLAALTKEAESALHKRYVEQENAERYGEKRLLGMQNKLAMTFERQIRELPLTEQGVSLVPQLDAIQRDLGQAGLNEQDYTRLSTLVHTYRESALRARNQDDDATERRLVLELYRADTPAQYQAVIAEIQRSERLLTSTTLKTLLDKASSRQESTHWTRQPGFVHGRQLILSPTVSEGGSGAYGALLSTNEQQRRRTAVDLFEAWAEREQATSITGMNARAPEVAREYYRAYVAMPEIEEAISALPAFLRDEASIKRPDVGRVTEDRMGLRLRIEQAMPSASPEEKERLARRVQALQDAQHRVGPVPGAGTPGLGEQKR